MEQQHTRRVLGAFFVAVVLLCAMFVLTDGALRRVPVVLSSLIPAIGLPILLRRRRGVNAAAWWWAVAAMVFLTAQNLQTLVQIGIQGKPAVTGIGPLVTLPLGYLCLLVGSVLIAFPFARRDLGGVIDAVIIAFGGASLLWTLAVNPALEAWGASSGDHVYRLVIILLVSGIIGAVTRALATSRAARPSLLLLLLASLCTLVGIVSSVLTKDPTTGAEGWWIGMVWIVGYLALGAAAAHPAHRHLGSPDVQPSGRLTRRRLTFLGAVLLLNPVLAGVTEATGGSVDWLLLTAASVVLVPLVILRIAQLAQLHAEAEGRLAHLAAHDELTGLANRRTAMAVLERAIEGVRAGTSPGVVLCFVDLDAFKVVNDEHGHPVGDQLLVTVARRLTGSLRTADLVARFGGDEFLVVCEGDPDEVDVRVRRGIERCLVEPIALGRLVVTCRASVGTAAVRPGHTLSADELLSAADAAMYDDKRARRATEPGTLQERTEPSVDAAR